MSLNPVSAVPSSEEAKLEPCEKHFYEISFLNTISLVFLKQANPTGLSRVQRILKLMISHFDINLQVVSELVLLDVETARFVRDDSDLTGTRYFLAFVRIGFELPQEDVASLSGTQRDEMPLLKKRLFRRVSPIITIKERKQFAEGRVEVLEPDKTRKMEYDFVCPFIDCDKYFKRSCDLMVHFRVETDVRPFECHLCRKTFRRKILLNKHLMRMSCVTGTSSVKIETADLQPSRSFIPTNSPSEISERPGCHQCGKVFSSEVQFYQHLRLCNVQAQRKEARLRQGIQQIAKSEFEITKDQRVLSVIRQGYGCRELVVSCCFLIMETAQILKEEFGIETKALKLE